MTHAFVTLPVEFDTSRRKNVETALGELGNPATETVRDLLRHQGIHFISALVVPGDIDERDILVIEFSADGSKKTAIDKLTTCFGRQLIAVLSAAGVSMTEDRVSSYLAGIAVDTGQGLTQLPGLNFSGTPGMSVSRIRDEWDLAREVRNYFDKNQPAATALGTLAAVRTSIAGNEKLKALLTPEPLPFSDQEQPTGLVFYAKLVLRGLLKFFWPVLVILGGALLIAAAYSFYGAGGSFSNALETLAIGVIYAVVALLAIVSYLYLRLRKLEDSDVPDNSLPDAAVLEAVTDRENRNEVAQNHLAGVSIMKPGLLRKLTLRMAFWVIGQLAAKSFRPGFLGDIGTIHFARWVMLPGSNKLLFLSNYGGSWESYLEDFITKASDGLTGVWSNTYGYPRTENLFFKGAEDGDRFKRWARRQQQPTRFWYSAYPHLTTERVRRNAKLRAGLALASSESEAAEWLSLFASALPPRTTVETDDVQSLILGGLPKHRFGVCVLISIPAEPLNASSGLQKIQAKITFGNTHGIEPVWQLAFSQTALEKLGVDRQALASFPLAFRQGMDHPSRQRILVDTGEDDPKKWSWGNRQTAVDAAVLIYTATQSALTKEIASLRSWAKSSGFEIVGSITMSEMKPGVPAVEPFGFADGISQPIINGLKVSRDSNSALNTVEPGEFILGYPDNRQYLPLTPTISAMSDPDNILPVADDGETGPAFSSSTVNANRDLGRNGSFLVVRQIEQHAGMFNDYLADQADQLIGHPSLPATINSKDRLEEWIAAKMVGRWKDGTSLVRFPDRPGISWADGTATDGGLSRPDNDFLFGAQDASGQRCPYGSHIRRSNPRDSFRPGSQKQVEITNRHRILRRGRTYSAGPGEKATKHPRGLLFMCLNGDIERQFEFIQQTWSMTRHFHGLDHEVDPILGRGRSMGRLTIPTARGPLVLKGMKDFTAIRGGGYFFMPGARTMRFLCNRPASKPK